MNRFASRNPEDFEERIEAMRDQAEIRSEEKRTHDLKVEGETELVTRAVHPATGEVLDLDKPDDELARFLYEARDFEWKLREAKKVIGNELLRRMDADASWTKRAGDYKINGDSPAPKVEWDGELANKILHELMVENLITQEAAGAAVEEVIEYKPKPRGLNALMKREEVAERLGGARTEVEKDRRPPRVEKLA